MLRQMLRPRPVPCPAGFVVKGDEDAGKGAGEIPTPVSATSTATRPGLLARGDADHV